MVDIWGHRWAEEEALGAMTSIGAPGCHCCCSRGPCPEHGSWGLEGWHHGGKPGWQRGVAGAEEAQRERAQRVGGQVLPAAAEGEVSHGQGGCDHGQLRWGGRGVWLKGGCVTNKPGENY